MDAPAARHSGLLRAIAWLPARIRREFRTRGGDARFLMWVGFLTAFVWARTWVLYVGKHSPNFTIRDEFQVGSRIVIAGYHPHHIALGVLLLAIAGWLGIHYAGRQLTRVMAVLYGVGLGLIVDEVGFIVEGIVPYRDDFPEVFVLAVLISALMMSSVYFPSFWASLELRVRHLWWRHDRKRRAPGAPEVAPAPSLLPPDPAQAPEAVAEAAPPKP